jgi:hypothetical protein
MSERPELEVDFDSFSKKGDLLTRLPSASPLRPMLCLGVLLTYLASGLSFSLLPETFLSLETLLSPAMVGNATFRSLETLLEPDAAGIRSPLAIRGLTLADMPSPIAAFGVDATPVAEEGDIPRALFAVVPAGLPS